MNVNNTARGFIPELWDAKVYRTLEDNLILEQICKAPLMGKASAEGDTEYFTEMGDPTISDYSGTLTAEELKDSMITMLIDKTKTFCFSVRDLDKLMANADIQGSQTQRAGYNLADAIEKYVLQYVAADANAGTALTATVTSATAISTVSEMARQLKENNVKEANMFMAIPPWFREKLEMAGVAFQINTGINGTGGMAWAKIRGFTVYESNTVYNSGTQASPVSTIIGGSYQAIGFKKIQLPVRTIELSGSRGTQIDGGAVFGFKVVKPKELSKLTATWAAETAI